MEPTVHIDVAAIRKMMYGVLEDKFRDTRYNPNLIGFLTKRTTDALLEGMKKFMLNRYKIVCTVSIIQNTGQSVRLASRFLWNDKFDNWVGAVYKDADLVAEAAVYMLYYE